MARHHKSKRDRAAIPGRIVSGRAPIQFDNATVSTEARCKVLVTLVPDNGHEMRRRFDRFFAHHAAQWMVVDALRGVIEVEVSAEHLEILARSPLVASMESVVDAPVPYGASGSGELSESATRFARLNRHQQREKLRHCS